ncbi:MAG: ATP synthase subunit C [Spirochaetota bacterium]|jgi:V/A-type H+-transporting ATPase subunit K|nr:ATP synthase subunit C [Spirochaetota bacterium]
MKKYRYALLALAVIILLGFGSFLAFAQENPQSADLEVSAKAEEADAPAADLGLSYIAAALAVGLSSLGAAWAVSSVGTAAMGAISEKPELSGRALIYVGLAEGIAIYGLIVAIMILGKV